MSRANAAGLTVAAMAGGIAVLALLALSTAVSASAMPRSYFELAVHINEQESPRIVFTFSLSDPLFNDPDFGGAPAMVAEYVNLTATVGSELSYNGTDGGTYIDSARDVGESIDFVMVASLTAETQQMIAENPGTPSFGAVSVNVTYTDNNGDFPRTIHRTVTFTLNYRPPASLLVPAAIGMGLGGAGIVAVGLFAMRRARLRELYLMHDSGMLIRHWSREEGVVHDSDIMSGMLIVLQDFVRDTWARNSEDQLDELTFGAQRVILVRGNHTVLAAVVQGRYLNGLPRKMYRAVAEFEDSHATVLADWNGNVDLLPRADDIAERFLKRRAHAAG